MFTEQQTKPTFIYHLKNLPDSEHSFWHWINHQIYMWTSVSWYLKPWQTFYFFSFSLISKLHFFGALSNIRICTLAMNLVLILIFSKCSGFYFCFFDFCFLMAFQKPAFTGRDGKKGKGIKYILTVRISISAHKYIEILYVLWYMLM